uniref:GA module-containing protein n=1 Tax=Staphylococcus epidermidis TaxID=1282 RepID=UPI0011A274D4
MYNHTLDHPQSIIDQLPNPTISHHQIHNPINNINHPINPLHPQHKLQQPKQNPNLFINTLNHLNPPQTHPINTFFNEAQTTQKLAQRLLSPQ